MFFVDDNLIFCRAWIEDTIQEILGKYERASGQKINSEKTNLFFSKGLSESLKDLLKICLEFQGSKNMKNTSGYLQWLVEGKRQV